MNIRRKLLVALMLFLTPIVWGRTATHAGAAALSSAAPPQDTAIHKKDLAATRPAHLPEVMNALKKIGLMVPPKTIKAPDFELLNLKGKPVRLSQYRGSVVLLGFWATW